MAYRIVNAEQQHLEALEELEKSCFSLPWTLDQLRSQLPDGQHEFLVAVSEAGEILGYMGMVTVLDEGYISNVAVSPNWRRQGIGDALIREMLHRSEERGLAFATLEVREHNEPAIALYTKHGFLPVGLRKNYYDFPKENAILMTKFWK